MELPSDASASVTRRHRHVVVPYGASNSTVRTRALHWIERCAPAVVETVAVHGPGFGGGRIGRGSDVLLLRNARRLTRGQVEATLLREARMGVYDLDDGLPWDDGKLPGLGRWWKRPWPRSLVASRAAEAADRVIVGNRVLADWAIGHCDDVRVVPTCVEPSDYRQRTSWAIEKAAPIIGWIGSPATQGYLDDIASALDAVHRRCGARVEVIGASGGVLGGRDFDDSKPWNELSSTHRIADWDVGIMPLRDGPYERAKCGYKLLQYAASGVPAVGSPVGVNRELLDVGAGLAPTTTDEWADALLDVLAQSESERSAMGHAGFELARRYSYDEWQEAWTDAVGWSST